MEKQRRDTVDDRFVAEAISLVAHGRETFVDQPFFLDLPPIEYRAVNGN